MRTGKLTRFLLVAAACCAWMGGGRAGDREPSGAPPPRVPPEIDDRYIKLDYWRGGAGQAAVAPELSLAQTPAGPAIRADAVAEGAYQGLEIVLPEPVDLADVGAITFVVGQNVRPGRENDISVMLHYEGANGLLGNVKIGADAWSPARLPIDLRTMKARSRQHTPTLGKVTRIGFSMYKAFNKPGQFLAVTDLRFHPVVAGSGPIPVVGYRHLAAPTSGDDDGTVLTDGRVDKAGQAFYRQYADNPDIRFDLGAVYLVDEVSLSAVAVPGQNLSGFSLHTSHDGEKWTLAGHVANTDDAGEEKEYAITGRGLNLLGRYIRLQGERARTDFPLRIAEVAFKGKIPTDAEIAAVADARYDLGPELPPWGGEHYATLEQGASRVLVCRANGVLARLEQDGRLLAERVFSRYERTDGKNSVASDGYHDTVAAIRQDGDALEVDFGNARWPDLRFTRRLAWRDGVLTQKLTIHGRPAKRAIFLTATEVVLPQAFRRGGRYETWGAGHDLHHKAAEEVAVDFPADSVPAVVFENPRERLTLLHYRFRYNDRYLQIGSGGLTVSGFGDKHTLFTPTGWVLGDGIFALGDRDTHSVESHWTATPGDLTAAYDRYLALPEVKAFLGQIKRPSWLPDIRLFCTQEWDGLWGDNGQRLVEHYNRLIREGIIIYNACDSFFHWGDFPVAGDLRNGFGGRLSAEELKARDAAIRASVPNAKIAPYTWLWSASKGSRLFGEHPDWFITRNASGREIGGFFPGFGPNYYRRVGIPESGAEIVSSITRYVNHYDADIWYLDGGGSPAAIDWARMEIDEPDAWDRTLLAVRQSIQTTHPERAVFFNTPANPIGDMGYLESFGGILTSNWRDGATWMYKFKLFQRHDPWFSPLYIYWGAGVDQAFRQYALGTGLGLTFGGDPDRRRDAAYISAWPQARAARLVDARVTPQWRYDPEEKLETMPLSHGRFGWVFLSNHGDAAAERRVAADLKPLGLADPARPVYRWRMRLRPHSEHQGLLGEAEREDNYTRSRWASDFLFDTRFLGVAAYAERLEETLAPAAGEMNLWLLTQSPALVYSVDNLRNQLWLPETLGVKADAVLDGDTIVLRAESTRRAAEVVVVLPEGKAVRGATLDGEAVATSLLVADGARYALLALPAGASEAALTLGPARKAAAGGALTVGAAAPGKTLNLAYAPADAAVSLAVERGGDTVWSASGCAAAIGIPAGATGGEYRVRAYDESGRVMAEQAFTLAPGHPRVDRFRFAPHLELTRRVEDCAVELPGRGLRIMRRGESANARIGEATFDPQAATIRLSTRPMYASHWNLLAGALEMRAKRFVQIRLRGNFDYFNRESLYPGLRGLSPRWDNVNTFTGLTFDFGVAGGDYTVRALGGIGLAHGGRTAAAPEAWGTAKAPDIVAMLSDFGLGEEPEETWWLDLRQLGAPADWDGRLWLGALRQNTTPDRWLEVTVLQSRDEAPAGAEVVKIIPIKGGAPAERKVVRVPLAEGPIAVDAVGDEKDWDAAPAFTDFPRLGMASARPPPTSIKLLRDAENLYALAVLRETDPAGFTLDATKQPWYSDGIELYFRVRGEKQAYAQYIVALTGEVFAKRFDDVAAGATSVHLDKPRHAIRMEGDTATIEIAVPLKALDARTESVGFNLARNRHRNQTNQLENYALAPGGHYRNFDAFALAWE